MFRKMLFLMAVLCLLFNVSLFADDPIPKCQWDFILHCSVLQPDMKLNVRWELTDDPCGDAHVTITIKEWTQSSPVNPIVTTLTDWEEDRPASIQLQFGVFYVYVEANGTCDGCGQKRSHNWSRSFVLCPSGDAPPLSVDLSNDVGLVSGLTSNFGCNITTEIDSAIPVELEGEDYMVWEITTSNYCDGHSYSIDVDFATSTTVGTPKIWTPKIPGASIPNPGGQTIRVVDPVPEAGCWYKCHAKATCDFCGHSGEDAMVIWVGEEPGE